MSPEDIANMLGNIGFVKGVLMSLADNSSEGLVEEAKLRLDTLSLSLINQLSSNPVVPNAAFQPAIQAIQAHGPDITIPEKLPPAKF